MWRLLAALGPRVGPGVAVRCPLGVVPAAPREEEPEISPRPRRSSRNSKESGGSAARRRFRAEGHGHSVISTGSGFSTMSVFDRFEQPERRRWRGSL